MSVFSELFNDLVNVITNVFRVIGEIFTELYEGVKGLFNALMEFIVENVVLITAIVVIVLAAYYYPQMIALVEGMQAMIAAKTGAWGYVATMSEAVKTYVKAFLDYIHFDTLVKLHKIAQIVSWEYRGVVLKFYGQVRQFGKVLKINSDYAMNLLMNARNIVLDVSALAGKNYDIAELEWVYTAGEYFTNVAIYAEYMKNKPESLLLDLQDKIEKPYINTKSALMLGIFTFIDSTATVLDEITPKVIKLKDDLEKTVLQLPESISRPIYEQMESTFEGFDRYVKDEFVGVLDKVKSIKDILDPKVLKDEQQFGNIYGMMNNPGELLSNINRLPDIQRLEQEGQITEIATRAYSTESKDRNKVVDEANKELVLIAEALKTERKPPEFLTLEYEGAPAPISIADGLFVSWQVGDY